MKIRKQPSHKKSALISILPLQSRTVIGAATAAGPTKTCLASSFLAMLLSFGIYQWLIVPQQSANTQATAKLMELRQKNEGARRVRETRSEFLQEFDRALRAYGEARELLPDEVEVSNVLAAIQEMASRDRVRLTRFDASKPGAQSTSPDKLGERVVPSQVIGTHPAVARFLGDIAAYPRIIHVREMAFTSLKNKESVDFTLATYYAPQNLPPVPEELKSELVRAGSQIE